VLPQHAPVSPITQPPSQLVLSRILTREWCRTRLPYNATGDVSYVYSEASQVNSYTDVTPDVCRVVFGDSARRFGNKVDASVIVTEYLVNHNTDMLHFITDYRPLSDQYPNLHNVDITSLHSIPRLNRHHHPQQAPKTQLLEQR
jgi:hypothetical protein